MLDRATSLAAIFVLCAEAVLAQSGSAQLEAQRKRIEAERAEAQAGFLREDAACYQKFAVNSCLGGVNERRRAMLSDLRRQEVLINDEDRRIRAEEQLRRADERVAEQAQREKADRQAASGTEEKSQRDRAAKKRESQGASELRRQDRVDANAGRLRRNQEKSATRAERSEGEAQAMRDFEDRQNKAQARRAENSANQQKRDKPVGKPLPVPP